MPRRKKNKNKNMIQKSEVKNVVLETNSTNNISGAKRHEKAIQVNKSESTTFEIHSKETISPIDKLKPVTAKEEKNVNEELSTEKLFADQLTFDPQFYINVYIASKFIDNHYGIVVFGKEYYLSEEGINVIEPGTWNNKEATKWRKCCTKKSEEDFNCFLRMNIFKPTYCQYFDSKLFVSLASDFLTLPNLTTSMYYLQAIQALANSKSSDHTSNVYINVYSYMNLSYHTGLVVFGKEYYYCKEGVFEIEPGTWCNLKPLFQTNYCQTFVSVDDFEKNFVKRCDFKPEDYGIFNHCNTFAELAYEFLTHKRLQLTYDYLKEKHTAAVNLVKNGNHFDEIRDISESNPIQCKDSNSAIDTTIPDPSKKERYLKTEAALPPENPNIYKIKSNSLNKHSETRIAKVGHKPRQVNNSKYFETRRSTQFYINSYFITILNTHYGIVVFGKEYYLSGEGINIIKPGTWNAMEAKKENGRNYFTNKSEEEFHEFLRLHIFDPKNYDSNFDSEFFTKLVNDFLTLDDVTRSINYLKAVATAGGRKSSSITSNLYVNYYNYMNFWYHTGIVVYGKEYFFCIDGVMQIKPGTWNGQKPIYRKNHCQTQVSMDDFEWDFVKQTLFKPEAYSTFNHNCNTFTELAYEFLTHARPKTTANYHKAKSTAAANLVNRGNYYLQKVASATLGDGGSTSKDGAMAGGSVGTAAVLGGCVGANTGTGRMRGAALGSTSYMATTLGAGAIKYGSVPASHQEEDTSVVVSHSRKDRATEEFEELVSAVTNIFNFFTKN